VHDAGVGARAVFLGQDAGHVLIGVAGMDDERQARLARGRDVDAQALLLHLGAVGGVVVVEPAFADADEFRVLGQGDQLVDGGHGLIGGAHRVGAGGPEDGIMGLGDGAHLRGLPQFRADRHHAAHTGGHGPVHDLGALGVEIGEIQVAMAVDDLEWCVLHGIGRFGRVRGAGSGGGHGQPLGGPVEIEEHIEDERGRVKVDRLAAPGPRGEVGGKLRPGAGGGGSGARRVRRASSPGTMGAGVWPVAPRPRQPRQQPVEQRQRQVEARLRPARARGIREFQRGCAVHARQARHQADEVAVKRRAVLLHQLHGRADGAFGEGGDGLGAGVARQGETGLIRAARRSSEPSGSNRSVRQRERMVGKGRRAGARSGTSPCSSAAPPVP
jgi:hypothetical protein